MSDQLRLQILCLLQERHKSGLAQIKEDSELATELNQPLLEMQAQLDILEDQKLVTLYKSFGPSYGATITPRGLLYLEQVETQIQNEKNKRPLGFRSQGSK